METIQEIVQELNAFIKIKQIKPKHTIKPLLYSLKEKFSYKFIFLNGDYYNEEILEELKMLKINYVRINKIGLAAKFRQLEIECSFYSEIRNRIQVTASMFYFESDTLMYFQISNTYVDASVRMYFKELNEHDPVID